MPADSRPYWPAWHCAHRARRLKCLPDIPVNVISVLPGTPDTIFAGTDSGLLVSHDDGLSWQEFGTGLPPVPVIDMRWTSAGRLVIGTQGRGAWEAVPQTLKDG
jgi:hypothetical protein